MQLKLYVVPASHPCAAVEGALQAKGLVYERVDLLPVVHVAHQRIVFGQRTVPGLKLDDEKVVGSRAIVRRLEALAPEPPLLPADPARRARVEEAEAWGDEVLQPIGRRLLWTAFARRRAALASYSADADLPVPIRLAMLSAPLVVRLERALNRAGDDAVRADLRALPAHLDRVERWIEQGVLGGTAPNAADLQIASTLRLLLTLDDLAGVIGGRPAGALARRWFPSYPGRVPAGALPAS